MRILLTVQGEGRGHLTQALALRSMLSRLGHELAAVVVGKNSVRELPGFFLGAFTCPVVSLPSPGFVFRRGRAVNLPATLWRNFKHLGTYNYSLRRLRGIVEKTAPDLIINCFEPLAGLLRLFQRTSVPVLSIAHQYMVFHPEYVRPLGRRIEQWGVKSWAALVGWDAWKLALSLDDTPDLPDRRLLVCPPLLRPSLFQLQPTQGDYVLVYLLNHGYSEDIRAWHRTHPEVKLHCFYDHPDAPEEEIVSANLSFYRLDGGRFLRLMAGCRAVVCTAGFESVCEAAWLGKPVYLVPVEGHLEQATNALDAVRLGFGLSDPVFRLDRLTELPTSIENTEFQAWVKRADEVLEHALERVAQVSAESRSHAVPEPAAVVAFNR